MINEVQYINRTFRPDDQNSDTTVSEQGRGKPMLDGMWGAHGPAHQPMYGIGSGETSTWDNYGNPQSPDCGEAEKTDPWQQISERLVGVVTDLIDKVTSLSSKMADLLSAKGATGAEGSSGSTATTPGTGTTTTGTTSTTTPTTSPGTDKTKESPLKKSGEFLWKPESEKDKKLAVLLPSKLKGNIKSVALYDPKTKKTLEKGKSSGVGNGDRSTFRFNKAGEKYPDGLQVRITLKDGGIRTVPIKETSARYAF